MYRYPETKHKWYLLTSDSNNLSRRMYAIKRCPYTNELNMS